MTCVQVPGRFHVKNSEFSSYSVHFDAKNFPTEKSSGSLFRLGNGNADSDYCRIGGMMNGY